jgi:protein tyrosine phosphatase
MKISLINKKLISIAGSQILIKKSAGIGRTGTLIGIFNSLEHLKQTQN